MNHEAGLEARGPMNILFVGDRRRPLTSPP